LPCTWVFQLSCHMLLQANTYRYDNQPPAADFRELEVFKMLTQRFTDHAQARKIWQLVRVLLKPEAYRATCKTALSSPLVKAAM